MTNRPRFLSVLAAVAVCGCSAGSPALGDDNARDVAAENAAYEQGMSGAPPGVGAVPGTGESAPGPIGPGHFGGQTGGEAGIQCTDDAEIDPLDFDAPSPLGYSAADILSGLAANYSSVFSYDSDQSTSELTVTLASDGAAGYAPGCRRNELDVAVGWATADGAFTETLHGKLFAVSPDSATLTVEVPADSVLGSYPSTHAATLGPAPLSFVFALQFDPTSVHGSVNALSGDPDAQTSSVGSF
jgi:hypothetical protein